VSFIYKTHV